jgi:hypothetical protein
LLSMQLEKKDKSLLGHKQYPKPMDNLLDSLFDSFQK